MFKQNIRSVNTYKIVLIILSLGLLISCNKSKKKLTKKMIVADSLLNEKDYKEAKYLYEQLREANPDNELIEKKITEVDSLLVLNRKFIQYQEFIKIADSLFNNNEIMEAEYVYQEAALVLPDAFYPKDKIEEIKNMQNEKVISSDNSYHLIVGCFAVKDNAIRLREKLVSQGLDAHLIPRENGTMNAVAYTTHPDIHDAYNHLNSIRRNIHKDTWVLRYMF